MLYLPYEGIEVSLHVYVQCRPWESQSAQAMVEGVAQACYYVGNIPSLSGLVLYYSSVTKLN